MVNAEGEVPSAESTHVPDFVWYCARLDCSQSMPTAKNYAISVHQLIPPPPPPPPASSNIKQNVANLTI